MTSSGHAIFVVPGLESAGEGGLTSFIRRQGDSLRALGWTVDYAYVESRTNPRTVLNTIHELRQRLRRERPQVVHAQYGSVVGLVGALSRGPVPLVVSFCGDDILGTETTSLAWKARILLSKAMSRYVARRADWIVVKSANLERAVAARWRNKLTVLPNGVDLELFRPIDRTRALDELGLDPTKRYVLFNKSTDSNVLNKDPALAEAAFAHARGQRNDLELLMMAGVPAGEVVTWLNAADVLLVTSKHEGSPNIVKEAMACNVPVVSVPCGDVEERLIDVQPGGVHPYDAQALGEAIVDVLEAGRRSNGREQLEAQRLSQPAVAHRLIAIYAETTRGLGAGR